MQMALSTIWIYKVSCTHCVLHNPSMRSGCKRNNKRLPHFQWMHLDQGPTIKIKIQTLKCKVTSMLWGVVGFLGGMEGRVDTKMVTQHKGFRVLPMATGEVFYQIILPHTRILVALLPLSKHGLLVNPPFMLPHQA